MKQSITKKQSTYSLWSILFLFLGLSCTETDVVDPLPHSGGEEEVESSFNLQVLTSQLPETRSITLTADGAIESDSLAVSVNNLIKSGDSIQSKAAAPLTGGQESKLSDLWVGQYDASTGQRLFSQHLSSLSGNTVNIKLKVNTSGQSSRVYFVANAGDLGAVADTTTLKARTLPYGSTATGLPDNNLCMMMGQWNGAVPSGGISNIEVDLKRLIAKISFTYAIDDTGFSFTPTSVSLKNAPSMSQVAAPTGQLTTEGLTYKTYTGELGDRTFYWYLPENMAGTVSGANAVTSEKQKTGKGVTNATCIELRGNAVQGGVSYGNVLIRFFPGADENNYDIVRNAHYRMNVTLVGLDVSDDRITVGEIPPFVVDQAKMAAKRGSKKNVRIPTRPGIPWQLDLPAWLSALVDGTPAPANSTITYNGPALITFQTTTVNPKAEDRKETINLKVNNTPQFFELTQSGSTLVVKNEILLDAEGTTEKSALFTATEELPWTAILSGGWFGWSATTNPSGEGTGAEQQLKVKASGVNPLASERTGKITLKAGASVTEAGYTGLQKEVSVKQKASVVTGSKMNIAAQIVRNNQASFTATAGLPWSASVGSNNWISITSGGSGTPTTGSPQSIQFDVALNSRSTARNGVITVRAGNSTGGPVGQITVSQSGSTFTLPGTLEFGYNGGDAFVTATGTPGLAWKVTPSVETGGIKPLSATGTIGGSGQSKITFRASKNTGPPRSTTFTVAVPGGNHSKTVLVKQAVDPSFVRIDDGTLKRFNSKRPSSDYPPFDIDGDDGRRIKENHPGVDFASVSPSSMTGSYHIQVQRTQRNDNATYIKMRSYCSDLVEDNHDDWRLPTIIELYAMWDKVRGSNMDVTDDEAASSIFGAKFRSYLYWSSSAYLRNYSRRCILGFHNGKFDYYDMSNLSRSVRCVRDIN